MVGDKISNLIISLKNASAVKKSKTSVSLTKLNTAILQLLQDEKYIESFDADKKSRTINVVLKYNESNRPAISEVKRISKLSRRVYSAAKEIKRVKNGFGLSGISAPLGIMSGKTAEAQKVGGGVMVVMW